MADLTRHLDLPDAAYSGIVAAGTFTTGHVGPEAFDELMRVAAPGATFTVSVHSDVYETGGFAARFAGFGARIADFRSEPFRIFGPGAGEEHAGDLGWIVSFRKV